MVSAIRFLYESDKTPRKNQNLYVFSIDFFIICANRVKIPWLRNLLKYFLRKWFKILPFAQIIFGFREEFTPRKAHPTPPRIGHLRCGRFVLCLL